MRDIIIIKMHDGNIPKAQADSITKRREQVVSETTANILPL